MASNQAEPIRPATPKFPGAAFALHNTLVLAELKSAMLLLWPFVPPRSIVFCDGGAIISPARKEANGEKRHGNGNDNWGAARGRT